MTNKKSELANKKFEISGDLLLVLLLDKTTNKNIIWGTSDYSHKGDCFEARSEIKLNLITGINLDLVQPRVKKNEIDKKKRAKEKAEVFTPSWACNHQNNLIDDSWFSKPNNFNFEISNGWKVNEDKISFPEGRTWMDYVLDTRLEITCGEAPYISSRYDAVRGDFIELKSRIGILDRKMRVINENVKNTELWIEWTKKAFESVYGYEWQGDNLLIARKNLLYTFIDYYYNKFESAPSIDLLKSISEIISWNFWQMDGLKGVVPFSCDNKEIYQLNLFGDEIIKECAGCKSQSIEMHNGIYCEIMDWKKKKKVKFINILGRQK